LFIVKNIIKAGKCAACEKQGEVLEVECKQLGLVACLCIPDFCKQLRLVAATSNAETTPRPTINNPLQQAPRV
jgi:hypothetical protein